MSDIIEIAYQGHADTRLATIAAELHDLRGSVDQLNDTLQGIADSLRYLADCAERQRPMAG